MRTGCCRNVLFGGNVLSLAELDAEINAINASKIRDVCMQYIYDKCPAVSGVGELQLFYIAVSCKMVSVGSGVAPPTHA